MRISDWSSDVCSSDLGVRCRARAAGTASERTGHGTERAAGLRLFVGYLAHGGPCAEIGRASCRERVCQYVSISVVAVSLKKNREIKIHSTHQLKSTTTSSKSVHKKRR